MLLWFGFGCRTELDHISQSILAHLSFSHNWSHCQTMYLHPIRGCLLKRAKPKKLCFSGFHFWVSFLLSFIMAYRSHCFRHWWEFCDLEFGCCYPHLKHDLHWQNFVRLHLYCWQLKRFHFLFFHFQCFDFRFCHFQFYHFLQIWHLVCWNDVKDAKQRVFFVILQK